jgi:hypothetical protein
MFIFYSVHSPQPGKEVLWVQKMRQFDELIKKQPGVIFVSDIFPDPEKGTLTGQAAWKAAWPVLVQEAPSGEWEVKPPEVYLRNSAG